MHGFECLRCGVVGSLEKIKSQQCSNPTGEIIYDEDACLEQELLGLQAELEQLELEALEKAFQELKMQEQECQEMLKTRGAEKTEFPPRPVPSPCRSEKPTVGSVGTMPPPEVPDKRPGATEIVCTEAAQDRFFKLKYYRFNG